MGILTVFPRLPSFTWWLTVLGTLPPSLAVAISNAFHHIWWGIGLASAWVVGFGCSKWPGLYNKTAIEEALRAVPTSLRLLDNPDLPENAILPEDMHVRCAIFVPIPRPGGHSLRCITDYMPDKKRPTTRELSDGKGIIGKAYRTKETHIDLLADPKYNNPAAFRDYQHQNYQFTMDEAKELRPDRRAYLASPVCIKQGGADRVVCVVYMDADNASAFGDAKSAKRIEALGPFFYQLLQMKGE